MILFGAVQRERSCEGNNLQSGKSIIWLGESETGRSLLPSIIPFEKLPLGAELIKQAPTRIVVRVTLPDGRAAFVKRYRLKSCFHRMASWVHASKARREYQVSLQAAEAGIPVAPVLGAAEVYHRGLLFESYVIQESVEPARSLLQLLRHGVLKERSEDFRRISGNLAGFTVFAHDHGFLHDDFRTDHILLKKFTEDSPEFILIDLDNSRLLKRPLTRKEVLQNLVQLNRSLWKDPPGPLSRMRFLRTLIRIHSGLRGCNPRVLFRQVFVCSAIREYRLPFWRRIPEWIRFQVTGQIPEQLRSRRP